ncbi:hypothetical protein Salat_2882200 [Sesamum alatum]|uniref:Uncharacterized protein n=1 Tax=Sesamum alatum TaxID=300844 RepID=A0AAE2CA79_9LAMI|nr:hypothetical protein Salat_2882200 [Sesamum alatum]
MAIRTYWCAAALKSDHSSFLSIEPLSLIPLVQPSSRTSTIDATKIANSIIKEIRKRATIWHQISGGVERAAVPGSNFSFLFFGRLLAEGSAVKEQRGFGQLAAFEMAFPAGVFTFLPIPESSDFNFRPHNDVLLRL